MKLNFSVVSVTYRKGASAVVANLQLAPVQADVENTTAFAADPVATVNLQGLKKDLVTWLPGDLLTLEISDKAS